MPVHAGIDYPSCRACTAHAELVEAPANRALTCPLIWKAVWCMLRYYRQYSSMLSRCLLSTLFGMGLALAACAHDTSPRGYLYFASSGTIDGKQLSAYERATITLTFNSDKDVQFDLVAQRTITSDTDKFSIEAVRLSRVTQSGSYAAFEDELTGIRVYGSSKKGKVARDNPPEHITAISRSFDVQADYQVLNE